MRTTLEPWSKRREVTQQGVIKELTQFSMSNRTAYRRFQPQVVAPANQTIIMSIQMKLEHPPRPRQF